MRLLIYYNPRNHTYSQKDGSSRRLGDGDGQEVSRSRALFTGITVALSITHCSK